VSAKRQRPRAAKSVMALRQLRSLALAQVAELPNVVGSMIGRKMVGNKMTPSLCLTILVSEKVTHSKLARGQRIPSTLRINGREILLDVLHIPQMQRQAVFPPGARMTNDFHENGTMSCLCESEFGIFGMGCAHALDGPDQSIATSTPVRMWSASLNDWVPIGETRFGVEARGLGQTGEFGFLDAAIFDVQHPELIATANMLSTTSPRAAIPGMQVHGVGAMRGDRHGRVLGIEKDLLGLLSDVVIEVAPPGTFAGDSGMLWRSAEGFPIAIHAFGAANGALGSRYTAAMLASRAVDRLGVEMLAPLP
jgi:hypothetical protein